jgi:hypothetical protein
MPGQWKEVARLHFKGERFRDHALDLSALSELRQFQKMVAETAKALWRKANPDRKQLPRNFEDRTRLCLRRIEEGSAAAPLEVYIEEPSQSEFFESEPVEANEAIDLAYRVFESVHVDRSLPDEFPKELLSEYASWGKSLAEDEILEFATPKKRATRITARERERLSALTDQHYEDTVDIAGHVLEADVRQRRFQLWIDDRSSVQVSFTQEQEEQVTTALKDHNILLLRVRGRGDFAPRGTLQQILTVQALELIRSAEPEFDASAPAIEDVIADIFKDISEDEWNTLPADLSENHDFYLYGKLEE